MEVSLANAITTTTNGPTVAVQMPTASEPITFDIQIDARGTSGAQSIIFDLEGSATGLGSWTTIKNYVVDGTYTQKVQSFQQVISKPYTRVNVTTISGTGASLSVRMRNHAGG